MTQDRLGNNIPVLGKDVWFHFAWQLKKLKLELQNAK
jgi:hypothetical protein